jgi:DNA-binding NarL/FixJ family response regulator
MTDDIGDLEHEKALLRTAAAQSSIGAHSELSCQAIWRRLLEGDAIVVDEFFYQERSFLAFRRRARQSRSFRMKRDLDILEQALSGIDQKVLASELRLASSTITAALRRALEFIGLECIPSRAPLLLALLAHAAKHSGSVAHGHARDLEFDGRGYCLFSARVPECGPAHALSPAVRAVVRLRAEGRSHAEIAEYRRTSRRTVANQLASAFQRLGVSGRTNLIELLARS